MALATLATPWLRPWDVVRVCAFGLHSHICLPVASFMTVSDCIFRWAHTAMLLSHVNFKHHFFQYASDIVKWTDIFRLFWPNKPYANYFCWLNLYSAYRSTYEYAGCPCKRQAQCIDPVFLSPVNDNHLRSIQVCDEACVAYCVICIFHLHRPIIIKTGLTHCRSFRSFRNAFMIVLEKA